MFNNYCAICCDISDLPALQCKLKTAGVDFNAPTLFISECVLTYIDANRYCVHFGGKVNLMLLHYNEVGSGSHSSTLE